MSPAASPGLLLPASISAVALAAALLLLTARGRPRDRLPPGTARRGVGATSLGARTGHDAGGPGVVSRMLQVVGAAALAAWAAGAAGLQPAAGVVLVAAAVPVAGLVAGRRRRAETVARADRVLECCELLAAELSAGLAPEQALARAAAAEPTLEPAGRAVRLGVDVPSVLRDSAATPGAEGLARLAAGWEVSRRTGQRLTPAVGAAVRALRRDVATRRVVESELASARATARLLAVLPVAALLLGGGAGAGPWRFLLGTPAGVGCLAAGLACGVVGLLWIERIADRAGGDRR